MSNITPEKAWNSTPNRPGRSTGRQSNSGKEPPLGTRCNFVLENDEVCDTFPSWWVPGSKGRQRRCEEHRGK